MCYFGRSYSKSTLVIVGTYVYNFTNISLMWKITTFLKRQDSDKLLLRHRPKYIYKIENKIKLQNNATKLLRKRIYRSDAPVPNADKRLDLQYKASNVDWPPNCCTYYRHFQSANDAALNLISFEDNNPLNRTFWLIDVLRRRAGLEYLPTYE